MGKKKKVQKQKGSGNVQGKNINISGNVAGGDIIQNDQDRSPFTDIYKLVDKRPKDSSVDSDEIKELLKKIEKEANKGKKVNQPKLERWLVFLAQMADDIFQVTIATLANPTAGFAKAVQLISKKAKEKALPS